MNKKIEHRWIKYYEIRNQQWNGKSPSQIAEYLVMDTRTVKKYLAIKYIKYNLLRGRMYYGVIVLNDQALDWLSRITFNRYHFSEKSLSKNSSQI